MVFFLSVGLLIDLDFVWQNIGAVLLILFIVTVVKTGFNIGILMLLREPWPHAFISGVLLAQIGEFSFLLGRVGEDAGLIDSAGYRLIATVTAFTLIVTPLWLMTARRLLRIAIARAATIEEVVSRLRGGGLRALWWALRAGPIPSALGFRVLGRPHHKSVLDVMEPTVAEPLPGGSAASDDTGGSPSEAESPPPVETAAAETAPAQRKGRRRKADPPADR